VDGHPDPNGQGGFSLPDGLLSVLAALVSRHAIVGIQPVEGTFAVANGVPGEVGVGAGELVGQAGVVMAVAGIQVTAEAADGGRGLQVLQQLAVGGVGVAVRVWRLGWAWV
jgi:hypothetical protein